MNEHLIEFLRDLVEHCRTWGDLRAQWCPDHRYDEVTLHAGPSELPGLSLLVHTSVFDRVGHWSVAIGEFPLYRLVDPADWRCAETTDHTPALAAGGAR